MAYFLRHLPTAFSKSAWLLPLSLVALMVPWDAASAKSMCFAAVPDINYPTCFLRLKEVPKNINVIRELKPSRHEEKEGAIYFYDLDVTRYADAALICHPGVGRGQVIIVVFRNDKEGRSCGIVRQILTDAVVAEARFKGKK